MTDNAFKLWLHAFTAEVLAKKFKVRTRAIYWWRSGKQMPRPEAMRAIVKASKGQVSYGDIVEHHLKATNK